MTDGVLSKEERMEKGKGKRRVGAEAEAEAEEKGQGRDGFWGLVSGW